ncbi:MAG: DUF362 domain-containing protein [Treponema sp.]|jgi:uncharacterized Fe-S center protein|nr:DUF362 domain-containing protein [Treponema sp.]
MQDAESRNGKTGKAEGARVKDDVLKKEMSRRDFIKAVAAGATGLTAIAVLGSASYENSEGSAGKNGSQVSAAGSSRVYMTADISARGLMAVYKRLGITVSGKVAIKLHMGERGNTNYLRPELLRDLAAEVKGSFVDSNTYYGGGRGTTQGHLAVAKEHGFTFAPVDILDADGDTKLPVTGGKQLKEAIVGAHILNYDWIISVAHFKGHSLAGFGGSFKNMAVGIASPAGKGILHSNAGGGRFSSTGEPFFEKVIEYNKALLDAKPGKILFINVLNNLSISCDCDGNAPKSTIADIGILASLDPVALEKASLDQIYARPVSERRSLVERIESRGGVYQITYAEKIGLGTQNYELVNA